MVLFQVCTARRSYPASYCKDSTVCTVTVTLWPRLGLPVAEGRFQRLSGLYCHYVGRTVHVELVVRVSKTLRSVSHCHTRARSKSGAATSFKDSQVCTVTVTSGPTHPQRVDPPAFKDSQVCTVCHCHPRCRRPLWSFKDSQVCTVTVTRFGQRRTASLWGPFQRLSGLYCHCHTRIPRCPCCSRTFKDSRVCTVTVTLVPLLTSTGLDGVSKTLRSVLSLSLGGAAPHRPDRGLSKTLGSVLSLLRASCRVSRFSALSFQRLSGLYCHCYPRDLAVTLACMVFQRLSGLYCHCYGGPPLLLTPSTLWLSKTLRSVLSLLRGSPPTFR